MLRVILIDDALKKAESTPRSTILQSGNGENVKKLDNVTSLVTIHHLIQDNIGAEVVKLTSRART